MTFHLQYLTDSKGKPKGVQIPYKEWIAIEKKIGMSGNKKRLLQDIKHSVKEMKAMQAGKLKEGTIQGFLDEF